MIRPLGRSISSYIDNDSEIDQFNAKAQQWLDAKDYAQIITLGTSILKRDHPLDIGAKVCGFLCQAYYKKEDFLNVMFYGKEFCKQSAHVSDENFSCTVLYMYAAALLKQKCEKEAFEILQILEPQADKITNEWQLNFIFCNYADLLEKQPNSNIEKVIALYERGHAFSRDTDGSLRLARLYLKGRKYEKCRLIRNYLSGNATRLTGLTPAQLAELTQITAQLAFWENYDYWRGN